MIAGVAKEAFPGERRVALVPAVVPSLKKLGLDVLVEREAGFAAGFLDAAYVEKGAKTAASAEEVFAAADVVLAVRPLAGASPKVDLFRSGQVVVGFLDPVGSPQGVRALAERGSTAFALELVPRITRAQAMDAL